MVGKSNSQLIVQSRSNAVLIHVKLGVKEILFPSFPLSHFASVR